jgi:hypothetical protein
VKSRASADERAVIDPHMPSQQAIVRDHHGVSDPAIMP